MKGPEEWNECYRDSQNEPSPSRVLIEHAHLLPPTGAALDLACGLGGNALFLAARGLETMAWDFSPVAIAYLKKEIRKRQLPLTLEVRNVIAHPPEPARFDVIVVSRFLERTLVPDLTAALKPGGLLYYQTFVRERVDDTGPKNDDYRLGKNELLALFSRLRTLAYREEGLVGDLTRGFRNEAMLVAQRTNKFS